MFYPDLSPSIRRIADDLRGQKVAVLGHFRPDGDCIGSQVGFCRVLRALDIDAVCVNSDPVPRRLRFLLGDTPFFEAKDFQIDGHLAISVDCADPERTGVLQEIFPEISANIDHHISNTRYAKQNFIDSNSAATAEILGGVALDNRWPIDRETAQAFYVGIATDTGQFRFPSTTRRVFTISGLLIDRGANPALASHQLYEQESLGKMRLLQKFLASLQLEFNGRVCIGSLDENSFAETGATSEDSEGLVDYARSIAGVDIAGIIEQRANDIKGSLRCKETRFRVDQIAALFNGGGHACAAGFNTDLPLKEFYPALLKAIGEQLDKVDSAEG